MEWYQIAGTVFTMEWTPDDEWRLFQTEQTECFDFEVCFEGSENSACCVRKNGSGADGVYARQWHGNTVGR